ncbi:MAG: NADP oxidoreductase [Zetaproteobacteria bacterium CG06_land_8_20_14_3_00_59_53]|nr:MAG: NADP oxidoreductase [Zetaproteobacteria bacterium CG2_30_59_37]PIO90570.1 MAG: NADP oxidoreductase [Zetaproteobacteria bacterium CG23_combo_of_CG06-09_8_20_14_all_59_86]PIQ66162.1 MAG: NADP oxidoreductase [Zetaproteobacteria bacterium CG11_big_fil_rev_8_21_14_0_20_59_439]PIU71518.1 MAG: NADP oxidoreductase [Zetaproteobacteria bacterium CG06_land_8_20_14_3_00_59_53]PIU97777.1 MAG: NADP oxidoreductase [Zetaproteobacteria bacterium CG03_land_8_20_14_0_80_59_51]PIY47345.1 MAG: NADP oxidore
MESHNGPTGQTGAHLLHRLFEVQQQYMHIPKQSILELAGELRLPVSQVESVVDFYSFFHRTPRGRFDLLFSNCTSCGDTAMMRSLCKRLNVTPGETRADGLVSINETSCIGMCDQGPALLVNSRTLTGLTAIRLEQIAAQIEAGVPVPEWPVEWFRVQDNVRKNGLLLGTAFETGSGLRAALEKGPEAMLAEVTQSGLRGRGGAGFSTGMKWKFCREAKGDAHYVVCNADEGEPGTFKDRILLSSHAHAVFEGMSICGHIIGASKGYLYLRGEYRYLLNDLHAVLKRRHKARLLGKHILGQAFDFDIEIIVGAGAYICGEESALIESMEQKRGIPRVRPPFPVTKGYLDQPTVVNNVETLAAAALIAVHGGAWFSGHGSEKSAGSKVLSISGDCTTPGVYEYPFGVSIQRILDDCGAEDVQAVQVGGPSGTLIAPDEFERKLGFEDLATGGSFMIYSKDRDLLKVISNFTHFFAHESCGFCTPCRVGTTLLKNGLDKIASGHGTKSDVDEMYRMATMVKRRSHCGLGQTAPNPLLDALKRFPEVFEQRLVHDSEFEPHFDLDAALEEARQISHRDDAEAHLA